MVEASLIESYEDNEEEMIDVRPIVSLDEGSSSVPTNFNSDQMVVMNSLDINSMTSNSPGLQSGKRFCSPRSRDSKERSIEGPQITQPFGPLSRILD